VIVTWYAPGPAGIRLARAFPGSEESGTVLTVRYWDTGHGRYRVPIEMKSARPVSKVQHLVLSADGRRLAADFVFPMTKNEEARIGLKVWDVENGRELFSPAEIPFTVTALALSPDGGRVAWFQGNRVRVWEIATKQMVLDVEESWELLQFMAFSPDGARLAWSGSQQIRVYDLAATRELLAADSSGYPGPLTFSPDGRRLAACVGPASTALRFTEMKVWDAGTGEKLLSWKGESGLQDITWSPDGRRLATLRANRKEFEGSEVKVWDAHNGLLLLRWLIPDGQKPPLQRVLFDLDGTRLFCLPGYPSSTPGRGFGEVLDARPREPSVPRGGE
jgi:WD40 repeat protein